MKTLCKIVIFAALSSCSNNSPLEIGSQDDSLRRDNLLPLSKKELAITDINFVDNRFNASVFYDNIVGPDGIAVLSNSKLFVIKEYGEPGPGIFRAEKGSAFSSGDAFSTIGAPFVSPDDIIVNSDKTVFVADGQAQTVFTVSKHGGTPVAFVTPSTTGSPLFNPFGLAIAPADFDGPNVDPGDLIVTDNAFGTNSKAVWAVNPNTGVARIIAQGNVFIDGPVKPAFSSDGVLFIFENNDSGSSRIVTLGDNGTVALFLSGIEAREFFAIHPQTDEIFFKKVEGEIYRVQKTGGTPQPFAANIGEYQDMAFNPQGTALIVSVRARNQVIQISAKKEAWE